MSAALTQVIEQAQAVAVAAAECAKDLAEKRPVQIAAAVVAGGALIFSLNKARVRWSLNKDRATFKKGIVYMYGGHRTNKAPSLGWSLKLETWLRLAKVPYVYIPTTSHAVSPTGTLPCIWYNGKGYADSQAIIEFLTKELKVGLEDGLKDELKAIGHFVHRTFQASIVPSFERALIVDNPKLLQKAMIEEFGWNPLFVKCMVPLIRKWTIKRLNETGFGDLTDEQYTATLMKDLKAIEQLIFSNGGYLMRPRPSSEDAEVFAHLFSFTLVDMPSCPAGKFIKDSSVLQTYMKRMKETCWADLPKVCANRTPKQDNTSFAK